MHAIDVLYLYEYAARELDVACAVKFIAEQEFGLAVHIAQHPYGELASDLARLRPRIVAFPQMSSSNIPYVIEWPEAIYINLMWEQILYKGNIKAKMPRGDFALNYAIHHAWGDFAAQHLMALGVPSAHIVISGNPAYFLSEMPYRRFFERRQALASCHNLDAAKPWVFFPENYNWAFYDDAQLQTFIDGGQTAHEVFAMRDFCRASFGAVMKWCAAAAKAGSVEVIARPRPATAVGDFRTAARQAVGAELPSHLHIIKDGTIREWIIASSMVISSYSTSLIDAAVAGKPIFMLEPVPIPEFIHMDWHDLVPRLRHQQEFETACLSAATLVPDVRLSAWARDTMMSRGDAILNLAVMFARLIRGEIPRPPVAPPDSLTLPPQFRLPPGLLFQYYKALRRYQRFRRRFSNHQVRLNFTHEAESVDVALIADRAQQWRELLAEFRQRGPWHNSQLA